MLGASTCPPKPSLVAPTWSWACRTQYPAMRFMWDDSRYYYFPELVYSIRVSAKWLFVKARGSQFNRIGSLLGLRGQVLEGVLESMTIRVVNINMMGYNVRLIAQRHSDSMVSVDKQLAPMTPIWLLLISQKWQWQQAYWILTLCPSSKDEQEELKDDHIYQRVGATRVIHGNF